MEQNVVPDFTIEVLVEVAVEVVIKIAAGRLGCCLQIWPVMLVV